MKKLMISSAIAILAVSPAWAADKPTDPEIAAIVVAANQVDVDAGKLAETMGTSDAVKELAKKMVTDHSSVNEQAVALVTKLGVTPKENDTSKKLLADGKTNVEKLKGLKGAAFDKAYVDNEVAYHEAVIGVVKNTLIPSASNADLKGLLVKVSPTFLEHLAHAKRIQASLK